MGNPCNDTNGDSCCQELICYPNGYGFCIPVYWVKLAEGQAQNVKSEEKAKNGNCVDLGFPCNSPSANCCSGSSCYHGYCINGLPPGAGRIEL